MKFKHLVLSFIVLFSISGFAQELPPIEEFMPEEYGAEDQNWAISQGKDGSIYFANNKGLLSYNGARWRLYDSPNTSIVRSVKVISDKIYTGCYMDFGFWEKNESGSLKYTSLVKAKGLQLLEDEEFWNILELENWLLFQSLDRIYLYNTNDDSFNVIDSKTTITKIYKVENSIYFQKINQGIYKFQAGKETLVSENKILKDNIVVNIFNTTDGLLFQTKESGFFIFENGKITPWDVNLNRELRQYSLYNSIRVSNGNFILGTVSNGIISINIDGKINFQVDQSSGLGNNTVLSLFEDKSGNVWLGLDHGINNINFDAPFRVYTDDLGVLGTIYKTLKDQNTLYLGTNQGLFFKNPSTNGRFNFVRGTEGQVWFLKKINGDIFCGHDKGTFVIKNGLATKISSANGTWQISEIAGKPNLLIQGNYNGLYILEKVGNTWRLKNKLNGFDISSRYFEFISPNELLVSHEYKGVYNLNLDTDLKNVISYSKTNIEKSIKSSLTRFNNKILYGSTEGVYTYNISNKRFLRDSVLSNLYSSTDYISGKLIVANSKLFAFSDQNISYAQRGTLSSNYQISSLPLPNSIRETKDGYENILHLEENKYLIGTTRGYIVLDLNSNIKSDYKINIDAVSVHELNGPEKLLDITDKPVLVDTQNHLRFSFSVTDYSKYLPSLYQYRLIGFNESWSNWTSSSEVFYENLPFGEYTFEAKAKVGSKLTENTISYPLYIEKPWYLKATAIVLYFIIGFVIVVLIHILYRTYYRNQRRKLLKQKEKELEIKELENEQQLMYFKNLDLQKDIEAKNRELGMSAMNLVKRNELLSTIKKELSNAKTLDDLGRVVKLINKSLNKSDDWKLFEEAFNNADKDFIKELKTKHPNLTSNDIRLCTYLRLNLSSKEIAPLLNISLRSVEVKRYRLRKKINLSHEESLTNYILQL